MKIEHVAVRADLERANESVLFRAEAETIPKCLGVLKADPIEKQVIVKRKDILEVLQKGDAARDHVDDVIAIGGVSFLDCVNQSPSKPVRIPCPWSVSALLQRKWDRPYASVR